MELTGKKMGEYLKKLRLDMDLSTRDVYEKSGVSNSYLSLVENGKRKASAVILKKLAPVYNISVKVLYEKAGYLDLIVDNTSLEEEFHNKYADEIKGLSEEEIKMALINFKNIKDIMNKGE